MFSGGRAPEHLRYDLDLVRMTRCLLAHNKPIASVRHGVETRPLPRAAGKA